MEQKGKHAFLILAFSHWDCLEALLKQLDDVRNDIYVHVNANSSDFDLTRFASVCKKSHVFFQKRYPTDWGWSGGYNAVFHVWREFLEIAEKKGCYSFFHYLTGQDMLLVNNETFHHFFDAHLSQNFLVCYKPKWYKRCRYSKKQILGRFMHDKGFKKKAVNLCRTSFFVLQSLVGYDKVNKYFPNKCVMVGDSHFSLSAPFVHYVNSCWDVYEKMFRSSLIPDESLFQTMIYTSPFKDTLYQKDGYYTNLRYIVWPKNNGGSPKDLTLKDLDSALTSGCLIARKFNEKKDFEAVKFLLEKTNKNGNSCN